MNSFPKKELLLSLVFPFLCFLWGLTRIIMAITNGIRLEEIFVSKYFPNATCFAAVLIGGVLCAALTFTLKIHTEGYLLKRLAVIGVVIIVHQVLILFTIDASIVHVLLSLAGFAAVIYQILKVQSKDTLRGERAVMMMSDPVLYWMIFWFLNFIVEMLIAES